MDHRWQNVLFMVVIAVVVIGTSIFFKDAIQGRSNWIDHCVVQTVESIGESHFDVRAYCRAKYRQMP